MTDRPREALRTLVDAHLACTDLFALAEIEDRMFRFDDATRADVWTSLDDAAKQRLGAALEREAPRPTAWAEPARDAAIAHEAGDSARAAELVRCAARELRRWPAYPRLDDLLRDVPVDAAARALLEILNEIAALVPHVEGARGSEERWAVYLWAHPFARVLAERGRWRWAETWLRGIGAWAERRSFPEGALLGPLLRANIARMCRLDGRIEDAARALDEAALSIVGYRAGDPDELLAEIVERELAIEAALLARARGLEDRARDLLLEREVRSLEAREIEELRACGDPDGAEWLLASLAPRGGEPSTDPSP